MATEDAPVQKVRVVSELPDIILTWFVSITGLAAALIFGVFAVLSWIDSQHAKAQANASNLIALAAICAQVNNGGGNQQIQAICGPFFDSAWPNLSAAVGAFLPYAPTETAFSSSFPQSTHVPSSSSSLPAPGGPSSSFAISSSSGVSGSTSTSGVTSTSYTPPAHTVGASSGHFTGASTGTHEKLALGIGLGVGLVSLLVSVLTAWKIRRRR